MQNLRPGNGETQNIIILKKMIKIFNLKLIKDRAQRYSFDFNEDDQDVETSSDQNEVNAGNTLLSCKRSRDISPCEQTRGNIINPLKAKLRRLLGCR